MPVILFRYLLREVVPQFVSVLIILSSIIVVSQLVRLSEVLVAFGVSLENVLLPFLFLILPFMSMIIPMAFLGAVIISFARLSADGEYTALLASGISLWRSSLPVVIVSFALYLAASACALYLEPWGRREFEQFKFRKAQTELDNFLKFKMEPGVFIDDFLGYVFYAESITPDRSRFDNMLLAPRSGPRDKSFTLIAPSGSIQGSVAGADLRMTMHFGAGFATDPKSEKLSELKFQHGEIDLLRIFKDRIFSSDEDWNDYRSYGPKQLWTYLGELQKDERRDQRVYLAARYLFHQRLASPFAIVAFAFFAMALTIQDQRHDKSKAYAGGIFTIMASYLLMMTFKWTAEKGVLPAPVAAWVPNVLLLSLGLFLMYQKNRLPLSESAFAPRYFPLLGRYDRGRRRAKHATSGATAT